MRLPTRTYGSPGASWRQMAIAVADSTGSAIYVGKPDGSEMKKVSTSQYATHPVFSPSGKLAWIGGGKTKGGQRVYVDDKAVSPAGFTAGVLLHRLWVLRGAPRDGDGARPVLWLVLLVGATAPEFAGSHFTLVNGTPSPAVVPAPDAQAPARYRRLHAAMNRGLVRSCHDLSEGGLAVALAEMAIAVPSSITSRLKPAACRSSGDTNTRPVPSMSTSMALPRKTRFHHWAVMGNWVMRSRNFSHSGLGNTIRQPCGCLVMVI